MRDTEKDLPYFNALIELRYNLLNNVKDKLRSNQIKPERTGVAKQLIYNHYMLILRAEYCRGTNMDTESIISVYNDIAFVVNDYSQKEHANLLSYIENNEVIYLKQYILSFHFDILDLLSLGILIDVPQNSFNLIVDIIDKDNVKDFLFEFLIQYRVKDRPVIKDENFIEFSWYKDRWSKLKSIIKIEDKKTAQEELKSFIENDWYGILHDTPIYNQHNVKNGNYVGYWCYVAAAIVKIKDLDDSSFRNNKFYPKDMVN